MCGIAGIFSSRSEKKYTEKLDEMLAVQNHRGPNQKGVLEKNNLTYGMTRLKIIDTEEHSIPYATNDQNISIVYNGEIYNHQEVRKTFQKKYCFSSPSDAETVLYNYCEKGESSFADYNGMYAFALYDARKESLFLVRDKAGEKPLFYLKTPDFFSFASEVKALLKLVKPVLNRDCISYEAYEFNVEEETLFKDIFSVMPGEYVRIDKNLTVTKHSYWKIWDNLIHVPDNIKTIERDLTELLIDSLELRTKNCVHQYGVFVSGGVDSALIACITKPDFIYTCHYPHVKELDELEYAQLVARKINKELVVVEPSMEDFERTQKDILYHLDTPCTWTSFSLWKIIERASQDIKVVLSGEGADELFSGYHRYHLLHHDEQIRHMKAMKEYSFLVNKYYGSLASRYARLVNRSDDYNNARVVEYLEEKIEFYFSRMHNDHLHGMGVTDFYTTMQEILQLGDRMNMAFSVENRCPFLDYRLIQYAYSMPSKYKIREGTTKWIIKHIAKKIIPKEIVERIDKRGFTAPYNQWFGGKEKGNYNRSNYKKQVFELWKALFNISV
ncbi:MAG: asparagine synthase (glutamine-hydrolyzing) [Nitrospinae bacterium]|nr:asparagine synthase (glutamine-hydrolyzing) [Nitrospinota bacterium]